MGAHGSKEKLSRSASERYIQQQRLIEIERERFGRFGKRSRGIFVLSKPKRTQSETLFFFSESKASEVAKKIQKKIMRLWMRSSTTMMMIITTAKLINKQICWLQNHSKFIWFFLCLQLNAWTTSTSFRTSSESSAKMKNCLVKNHFMLFAYCVVWRLDARHRTHFKQPKQFKSKLENESFSARIAGSDSLLSLLLQIDILFQFETRIFYSIFRSKFNSRIKAKLPLEMDNFVQFKSIHLRTILQRRPQTCAFGSLSLSTDHYPSLANSETLFHMWYAGAHHRTLSNFPLI